MQTSVLVVGAGPAGLNVAIRLHSAGVPTTIIERRDVAATIRDWPPGTRMFSAHKRVAVGGVSFPSELRSRERVTREEYLQYLEDTAERSGISVLTHHEVNSIKKCDSRFAVTARSFDGTESKHVDCNYVVVATGCMHNPLRLSVPGEDLPFVRSLPRLDFAALHPSSVCVIGGRHSAIEASLRFSEAGAMVTLVYRRSELNRSAIKCGLYDAVMEQIQNGRIQLCGATEVISFESGGGVHLQSTVGGQRATNQCDLALVACGFTYSTHLLDSIGVTLSNLVPQINVPTLESNVCNVFVVGTAIAGPQQSGYTHDIDNVASHGVTVADEIIRRIAGRC